MKAIINGKTYFIKSSGYADATGISDPGITNSFTVFQTENEDDSAYGVLNDLGINFGYRLILRGNRGLQEVTELTKAQVVIIRDNA